MITWWMYLLVVFVIPFTIVTILMFCTFFCPFGKTYEVKFFRADISGNRHYRVRVRAYSVNGAHEKFWDTIGRIDMWQIVVTSVEEVKQCRG